jgi:hypothetical protein
VKFIDREERLHGHTDEERMQLRRLLMRQGWRP